MARERGGHHEGNMRPGRAVPGHLLDPGRRFDLLVRMARQNLDCRQGFARSECPEKIAIVLRDAAAPAEGLGR